MDAHQHHQPDTETPLAKMARSKDPVAMMREYQAANPNAPWGAYTAHYNSLVGTVNASAKPAPPLSAQQLQPGLFETLLSMNRGRAPSADETQTLINGLQTPRSAFPWGPPR
jgi:hypothetical protein